MTNQWPSSKGYKFNNRLNKYSQKKLDYIENFFRKKYKAKYAFLAPSSRSSINILLRFLKFSRSHLVNIPKWSSHCLFETIGSIANVTVQNFNSDLVVVFHKWGNTFQYSNKSQIIIEDSVDSLPKKNFKPFVNNGIQEIISLPKIIGAYSGGIVLTNNKKYYNYGKNVQNENISLGIIQSKKKFLYSENKLKKFESWFYDECRNTSFDGNVIENISNCLENFDKNSDILIKRMSIIKKIFPNIYMDKQRIGPCCIFRYENYYKFNKELELKFFNFSLKTKNNNFEKCFIFPIHYQITYYEFKNKLKKLIKLNKK